MSLNKRFQKHQSIHKDLRKKIISLTDIAKVIIGRTDNCRHKFSQGQIKVNKVENNTVYFSGYHGDGITRFSASPKSMSIDDLKEFLK